MKIVIAVAAAVLLPGSAREVAAEKPGGAPAALEGKLHGAWTGEGPCDGRLPLRADGTYERKLHGPGGNNCAGTWVVRWDALPPTLVLTCKTSDDPMYIRKEEVKLIQLDDQAPRVQVPVRPDDASALARACSPRAGTPARLSLERSAEAARRSRSGRGRGCRCRRGRSSAAWRTMRGTSRAAAARRLVRARPSS